MRSFLGILILGLSAVFLGACGSEAAENTNTVIAEAENSNANVAPPASEPVPIFTDAGTALAEGNKYFDTSQTDKAVEAYKQAVKLNPDLAEAHFRLGVAYSLLDREEEATRLPGEETEPAPKKGKKKEPEKTNAEKAFENAIKIYKKIVKDNPEDDVAFYYLGRSYNKIDEDLEAAKALRQAVKLNPDNSEYQIELGEILIKLAEYDEAVRALKKALELDENNLQAEDLLEKAEAGRKRIEFGKKQIQQQMQQQEDRSSAGRTGKPRTSEPPSEEPSPKEDKPKPEPPKKTPPNKAAQ